MAKNKELMVILDPNGKIVHDMGGLPEKKDYNEKYLQQSKK